MAPRIALEHPTLGPLTDDLLTRDVRVWQRARGHRFSSDDVATAFFAYLAAPRARTHVDLGTGLGSVLLLLAWKMPTLRSVGVEAQEMSHALLTMNVERNELASRVTPILGDLRAVAPTLGERFDLVTGTPPYFPPGSAVAANDQQRTLARIEERGGVEAYLEAGARLVAPGGVVVLCGDARADARVRAFAPTCGLFVVRHVDVVPRAGRAPLFAVWQLDASGGACDRAEITLRDAHGRSTRDADSLRVFSGFPSLFSEGGVRT